MRANREEALLRLRIREELVAQKVPAVNLFPGDFDYPPWLATIFLVVTGRVGREHGPNRDKSLTRYARTKLRDASGAECGAASSSISVSVTTVVAILQNSETLNT